MMCRYVFITIVLLSACSDGAAQDPADTSYYKYYPNQITGRFYFSRKYTSVVFRDLDSGYKLLYRANTSINMGIGATYRWATLNLAYGFGFLNPDQGRGKTKYLDLQFHGYGRKFSLDVLGQFYSGFYLTPRGMGTTEGKYYVRPDIDVGVVGASAQYIFNYRQFSYRAAFLQNEWQKKSAGSFLLGAEWFTGRTKSDSSIVPVSIDPTPMNDGITRVAFIEAGPNAGYAYTYVYRQNYFITGAASVSLDLGWYTIENNTGRETTFGINPNSLFRISGGYNSEQWAFSILAVSNAMRLPKFDIDKTAKLRTGNVRVNVCYRFKPSRKVKKILKPIEEIGDKVNESN